MSFTKISKEEWLSLSKEEQDYLNFEFQNSVEKRKRITIILTRGLALALIVVLIFMGIAQIQISQSTTNVLDKYGQNGYCYLCGLYSLKVAQCSAFTPENYPKNMTQYATQLARYNALTCNDNSNNTLTNFYPVSLNLSSQ